MKQWEPPAILRSASDLVEAGLLPDAKSEAIEQIAATYPIGITSAVAALIDRRRSSRSNCPPVCSGFGRAREQPDEMADPTGDLLFSPIDGIVHRYPPIACS